MIIIIIAIVVIVCYLLLPGEQPAEQAEDARRHQAEQRHLVCSELLKVYALLPVCFSYV